MNIPSFASVGAFVDLDFERKKKPDVLNVSRLVSIPYRSLLITPRDEEFVCFISSGASVGGWKKVTTTAVP